MLVASDLHPRYRLDLRKITDRGKAIIMFPTHERLKTRFPFYEPLGNWTEVLPDYE